MRFFELVERLASRGAKYAFVGWCTFLLDMGILYTLIVYTEINYPYAIVLGFILAMHLNFYISYHWVFRGTTQKPIPGYLFFIGLALLGGILISLLTSLLIKTSGLPLLYARVLVGTLIGLLNFLLNTFFNFKLI